MANEIVDNAREWYARERPVLERFARSVRATLESLISQAGIEYLNVTERVKDPVSFAEKIKRKGYQEPEAQMTDIVGLRVIVYVESDVNRICELISEWFNVHPDKSVDKKSELGKDRFGYRSVHFVCDLGEQRLNLPENIAYRQHVFEVQVRTVLQHAWAEFQHDRGYKFNGVLPEEFERRFNSQAAVLEVVDRNFDQISREIDEYSKQVTIKAKTGNLNIEINSISLRSYIESHPHLRLAVLNSPNTVNTLIKELSRSGIRNFEQLDELLKGYPYVAESVSSRVTFVGIIRGAMMYADIDKYFSSAYQEGWRDISPKTVRYLKEKYGEQKVNELFKRHEINRS